jgi:hypothetical protein
MIGDAGQHVAEIGCGQSNTQRGGQYLVGTPRSRLKQFEQELLKDDFAKIRPEVEVKKIRIPSGEEIYILCRTVGRKEKEKAIRSRFVAKIEEAPVEPEKRIAEGQLKDRLKMEPGRLLIMCRQVLLCAGKFLYE